jgi:cytochrome c5
MDCSADAAVPRVCTGSTVIIKGCFNALIEIPMSSPDHTDHSHDMSHEGPIKTPMQLLMTVLFSFVVPVFIIIGLVYYVTTQAKPTTNAEAIAAEAKGKDGVGLGGLSAADLSKSVAARIQKVGTVEIRDANRALKAGEEIYKAQCVTCHGAGLAGAPKFGDAGAWGARIATGYPALWNSALKGKGAMGAQGGGDYDDVEIGRAVVYMTNAAGGKFPIPEPVAAAPVDGASAAASAPVASAASAPVAAK